MSRMNFDIAASYRKTQSFGEASSGLYNAE